MATETARPIPGWKPSTPDIGHQSLEVLCYQDSALAIHFWAPWNGVDPLMDRGIQQIANQFDSRVKFFSANIDTKRGVELAQRFDIASVPTLVVLKYGTKPTLTVGYVGAEQLAEKLESVLLAPQRQPWWAFWRRGT